MARCFWSTPLAFFRALPSPKQLHQSAKERYRSVEVQKGLEIAGLVAFLFLLWESFQLLQLLEMAK